MMWRVVKLTDRGYVIASRNFDDHRECIAACHEAFMDTDDYLAVQEMPSGAIVWDASTLTPAK